MFYDLISALVYTEADIFYAKYLAILYNKRIFGISVVSILSKSIGLSIISIISI